MPQSPQSERCQNCVQREKLRIDYVQLVFVNVLYWKRYKTTLKHKKCAWTENCQVCSMWKVVVWDMWLVSELLDLFKTFCLKVWKQLRCWKCGQQERWDFKTRGKYSSWLNKVENVFQFKLRNNFETAQR